MRRVLLCAAGITAVAMFLGLRDGTAALSAEPAAAADYLLKFSFTAVGGKRPPDIVGTLIAAKGRLRFDDDPGDNKNTEAKSATGTVVIELDVLTPHPRTERITLAVTKGALLQPHEDFEQLELVVEVVEASEGLDCPDGTKGVVRAVRTPKANGVSFDLRKCSIHIGQQAGTGSNSKVHVNFSGGCARAPARVGTSYCSKEVTFKLVPSLTKVENPLKEMVVNAAGGRAVLTHCCDGGGWKYTFTFKPPATVTVGNTAKMPISIAVSDVKPEQPLYVQMSVFAPDFRNDFGIQYPKQPTGSKTLAIPIKEYLKDQKEFQILVGLDVVHITYTYKRS